MSDRGDGSGGASLAILLVAAGMCIAVAAVAAVIVRRERAQSARWQARWHDDTTELAHELKVLTQHHADLGDELNRVTQRAADLEHRLQQLEAEPTAQTAADAGAR